MSIIGASLLTLKPHERQDNRHYAGHKTIYSKMDIYDGTHTHTYMTLSIHNLPSKRFDTLTIKEEYCKFLSQYINTHVRNAHMDDCTPCGKIINAIGNA